MPCLKVNKYIMLDPAILVIQVCFSLTILYDQTFHKNVGQHFCDSLAEFGGGDSLHYSPLMLSDFLTLNLDAGQRNNEGKKKL